MNACIREGVKKRKQNTVNFKKKKLKIAEPNES